MSTKLTLFISYAHEDELIRTDLEKHLASLKREGLVEEWHDRMILAGQDWDKQIHTCLDRSHIIIFLISPDFIASSYCNEVEVKRSMQRYEIGTAKVIPVLVRPTDYQGAPFSKLQTIPTDLISISEWKERDAAFVDVVRHLRKVCLDILRIPGNPANPFVVAKMGDWCEYEIIIEIPSNHQTKLGRMHLMIVEKNKWRAYVRVRFKSLDLGDLDKTIDIPLNQPFEDAYGPLINAFTEQIPANAIIESHQIAAGSEKLFIGGKTFYTTWVEKEIEVRQGYDVLKSINKVWMSPEIPLNGMVKFSMEIPGVVKQLMVAINYGREAPRPISIIGKNR